MGRRGYPPEFRRRVLGLVESGRKVADVARDLEISEKTIYTWRRQDRIDSGLIPGLTSVEKAELIVERHQKTSTIVTSNRDPSEWIALMSDPLLAQSAADNAPHTPPARPD